jgi:DNA invertase Pin-like site-specific DNA recombinase
MKMLTPSKMVMKMADGKQVLYFRVSTQRQGKSGLGLDAQREQCHQFLNGGQWEVIGEFVEVESGRRNDRPQLEKALKLARVHNARLVVAKIDRLSRSVAFISKLMESGVQFVAADMPEMNPLSVHILAAVAEHERKLISSRVKEALKQAKLRGVKLGSPKCYLTDEDRKKGSKIGAGVRTIKALAKAEDIMEIVEDIEQFGITSLKGIAKELTNRNVPTPRGKDIWYPQTVKRLYERVA